MPRRASALVGEDGDALLEEILAAAREAVAPAEPSRRAARAAETIAGLRAALARRTEELAAVRAELEASEHESGELEGRARAQALSDLTEIRALRWQLVTHRRGAAFGARERAAEARQQAADANAQAAEARGRVAEVELTAAREREELVRAHDEALEQLHRELAEETRIAENLEARLDRVERRLAVRAAQLQAIRHSRSFRLTVKVANLRYAALHPRRARRRRGELPAGGELEADRAD